MLGLIVLTAAAVHALREPSMVVVLSNLLVLVIFEAFDRVAQLVEQRTFNP